MWRTICLPTRGPLWQKIIVLYLLLPIAVVVGWIEHPEAMCVLTVACYLWRRQIKRRRSKCLWQ